MRGVFEANDRRRSGSVPTAKLPHLLLTANARAPAKSLRDVVHQPGSLSILQVGVAA